MKLERIITFTSLAVLVAFMVFCAGFAYRHFNIWPTGDLFVLARQISGYAKTGLWGLPNQFVAADVDADDPRVTLHDRSALPGGYRAILGYDIDLGMFSVRLFDGNGSKVHVWPIDTERLAGKTKPGEAIVPHGMEVFEDGSLVVNFDNFVAVIARIDSCGEPVWSRRGIYHHSIHRDDKGGIWTWYSPDNPAGQMQSIVRLDAETGKTLLEISLEQLIRQSTRNATILGVPSGFTASPAQRIPRNEMLDLFHPNDVEPLTRDLAPYFDMFEEGDLLISLRNINLVAVLDPDTLLFDWSMHGPWIQQHDPDFTRDGTIEIYDNARGRGRSQIVSVDPGTGEVSRLLEEDAPPFYSETQGKHQRLPSGDILVTVPKQGRVIEFSRDGDLVFEFNNIAGDGANAAVLNAMWLPQDFFAAPPRCVRN